MTGFLLRLLQPAYGHQLFQELLACGISAPRAGEMALQEQNCYISISGADSPCTSLLFQQAATVGCRVVVLGPHPGIAGHSRWLLYGIRQVLGTLAQILSASPEPDILQLGGALSSVLAFEAQHRHSRSLTVRNLRCDWGTRTYVMGIVNVTPDSFSGDGVLNSDEYTVDATARAVEQGLAFVREGADILDVGGESSRPGSHPVDARTEMQRILPVIRRIRQISDVPISVDTTKAEVFAAAHAAGADILNDISAMQTDPAMRQLAAQTGVPVVLMHRSEARQDALRRGSYGGHYVTDTEVSPAELGGMLESVMSGLQEAIDAARLASIAPERIIVDPGIGFGKSREENLFLVNHLDALRSLGLPILLGVSRKAFIGYTLDTPVNDRLEGTLAAVVIGVARGADIIRVHDVRQAARAVRMADALIRQEPPLEERL